MKPKRKRYRNKGRYPSVFHYDFKNQILRELDVPLESRLLQQGDQCIVEVVEDGVRMQKLATFIFYQIRTDSKSTQIMVRLYINNKLVKKRLSIRRLLIQGEKTYVKTILDAGKRLGQSEIFQQARNCLQMRLPGGGY